MTKGKNMILAAFLAGSIMVSCAVAGEKPGLSMGNLSVWSSLNRHFIWGAKEEVLGRISDLVIDPQGQALFVVVTIPGVLGVHGKNVAVPFDSFSYDREKDRFVTDISREKMFQAPVFTNRSLYSEKWAENMYRYFGKAPYWTEGELVEKGIKPMEGPADYGGTYNPFDYQP